MPVKILSATTIATRKLIRFEDSIRVAPVIDGPVHVLVHFVGPVPEFLAVGLGIDRGQRVDCVHRHVAHLVQ